MKPTYVACGLVMGLLSFTLARSTAAHSPGRGLLGVGMQGNNPVTGSRQHAGGAARVRIRINRFRSLELEQTIRRVFGRHGDAAVRIARCESGMDPSAINKKEDARGLFQIQKPTWGETRQRNKDRLDPLANIAGAFEIFARSGYSWRKWGCKNRI